MIMGPTRAVTCEERIPSNWPALNAGMNPSFGRRWMQSPDQLHAPVVMLEEEFERLKRLLGLNDNLKLRWLPDAGRKDLSGEVKNRVIVIYDSDYEAAVDTLKHELVDYMVSKAIEPYKEVANKLILLWNEEAYKRKEELVGCY